MMEYAMTRNIAHPSDPTPATMRIRLMTDPTPTRAEVEHHPRQDVTDLTVQEWAAYRCDDAGAVARKLLADNQALRERAEAAESECARLKNIRSAIAEGYNAEAVALEKSVSETITAQLTAARRAEAAAWNDAIEAAEAAYAQGFAAIRALRRAAPTEGEAHPLDVSTRAVLDRAERIVAGQSQQEQRAAEIFLRPTEGEA